MGGGVVPVVLQKKISTNASPNTAAIAVRSDTSMLSSLAIHPTQELKSFSKGDPASQNSGFLPNVVISVSASWQGPMQSCGKTRAARFAS